MSVDEAFEAAGQLQEDYTAISMACLDVNNPELWRRIHQMGVSIELVTNLIRRMRKQGLAA